MLNTTTATLHCPNMYTLLDDSSVKLRMRLETGVFQWTLDLYEGLGVNPLAPPRESLIALQTGWRWNQPLRADGGREAACEVAATDDRTRAVWWVLYVACTLVQSSARWNTCCRGSELHRVCCCGADLSTVAPCGGRNTSDQREPHSSRSAMC